MRRIIEVVVFAVVVVALLAAPAMAQLRDPFEPLVRPGAGVPDGTAPDTGTDGEVPPVVEPSEQVPTTGANTIDWTAGAYILIAFGGAFVVLGRLYGRPALRRVDR